MRSPCIYDSIHMERTHGPCVPTPLPLPFADMSAKTSMPKQARSTPTLDKMRSCFSPRRRPMYIEFDAQTARIKASAGANGASSSAGSACCLIGFQS